MKTNNKIYRCFIILFFIIFSNQTTVLAKEKDMDKVQLNNIVNLLNKQTKIPKNILNTYCSDIKYDLALFIDFLDGKKTYEPVNTGGFIIHQTYTDILTKKKINNDYLFSTEKYDELSKRNSIIFERIILNGKELSYFEILGFAGSIGGKISIKHNLYVPD